MLDTKYMSQDKQDWIKSHSKDGQDTLVFSLLLAELVNAEPDAIRQRLLNLKEQVRKVVYDL